MPKVIGITQSALDRYHERLAKSPAETAVERRALKRLNRDEKKRSSLSITVRRLNASFRARYASVSFARAKAAHDRPDSEFPRVDANQPTSRRASPDWKRYLSSTDFVYFVCDCLRIDIDDTTARLEVARWLERMRGDQVKFAGEDLPYIAVVFEQCIDAAVDEWNQDKRHGRREDATRIAVLSAMADSLHTSIPWNQIQKKPLNANMETPIVTGDDSARDIRND